MRPSLGRYKEIYKDLHRHPELSKQEARTAKVIAAHLRTLEGIEIQEGVGGYGVVGVLANGEGGQTVWLRADMDALPVEEKTGLDYASRDSMEDDDGVTKPLMHACGHDMHMACLLAAAEGLSQGRESWKGTVIFIFQPNEERGGGAQAMVDDGLYNKVPKADVILGQHLMPFKAGEIGTRRGFKAAAADSFRVKIFGKGGHASQPHRTVDPVLMAANIVVRLQSIVSRQTPPSETTVLTVGSIHAGRTSNIIPDEAVLELTVRSMTSETRQKVIAAMKRIVQAECDASLAPREPEITQLVQLPLVINDLDTTKRLEETFQAHFGNWYSSEAWPLGGSEDFPNLANPTSKPNHPNLNPDLKNPNQNQDQARNGNDIKDESTKRDEEKETVPYCFWTFGGMDPERWYKKSDDPKWGIITDDIPVNHSPFFAPVIQPTLQTGVDAFLVAALTFLSSSSNPSASRQVGVKGA